MAVRPHRISGYVQIKKSCLEAAGHINTGISEGYQGTRQRVQAVIPGRRFGLSALPGLDYKIQVVTGTYRFTTLDTAMFDGYTA